MEIKKIQIGKLLIDNKYITQEQLDLAMIEQGTTGKKLGQALIDLGFVKQMQLLQLLSDQLRVPLIDLKNYSIDPEIVQLLPEADARRLNAIVLNKDDMGLFVGMVDPLNVLAYDELEQILQQSIHIAIVLEKDLQNIIDISYRHGSQISTLSQELSAEMGKSQFDITKLATGLSFADAPVVKLLQSIFEDAAQVNASDIHIEPDEQVLRIRLRIDGVLHEQILKQKNVAEALSLRLKLMAGLNIAEKRMPQDGRFSIKIKNKNYSVRLSSIPGQFGESVVMRLLNQSTELLNLDQIGMPKEVLSKIRKIMSLPHGLFLITGPTGSGKTTSLYGMLTELNTAGVKIVTVEDPVEYRLPRITQVQVQSAINLNFARALRSILRQDPDIIMIGELRDKETAEIALRAAMTGHFVFSTLHTNDAVSSAERLVDMGVESYLVATVLRAVMSQRLLRRICQSCIEEYTPTPQEEIWLESVPGFYHQKIAFKQGKGCSFCYRTGYKGQIGVYEFLELTRELGETLRANNTREFIRLVNEDQNYQPLLLSGLKLVAEGLTTIDEVMHITGELLPDNPEPTIQKVDLIETT